MLRLELYAISTAVLRRVERYSPNKSHSHSDELFIIGLKPGSQYDAGASVMSIMSRASSTPSN